MLKQNKIIVFHPAIAPYRVDFFNELHLKFNVCFYFNHKNVMDQKFDQKYLQSQLLFTPLFLDKGFNIKGRTIQFGIVNRIIKQKPNVVICSEFSQITIVSIILKKILGFRFSLYTICDDSIDNSKSRKGLRALLRNFISKNIDGVIYASREVGVWNRNHISNKINALELPIIHSDEKFRNKINNSLYQAKKNIDIFKLTGKKILLFVGRLVDVKNIPLLLNTISEVDDDFVLIIVGGGQLEDELKSIVKRKKIENKVLFVGRLEVDALYSWFALAHVLILSSTYEPFGAVVNEALLGGCFVICSELAGASSLINDTNGHIFNPYDKQALIEKIKLVSDIIEALENKNIQLRKSKMPFTFQEKIDRLIKNL